MLTRRPLNVAVLCSRRAPGLLQLLTRSPRRGVAWNIACCLTSEENFDEAERVQRLGVPVVAHPVRRFYFERQQNARIGSLSVRAEYDRRTLDLLQSFSPDVVLLAGYLLVLTAPMLDAFDGRIVNVHHSDLLQRDRFGAPRYPGLRAVRDAIVAGETETRSTAHLVTERLDAGRPLVRSWAFPVPPVAAWARAQGAADVLRPVIWAHQEWMLRSAFGPLLARALDLVATEQLDAAVEVLVEPDARTRDLVHA
jgi:folate-dependent phosphoribosylglycinamide formyltransferase PurN